MKRYRTIFRIIIALAALMAFTAEESQSQRLKPGPQDLSFFSTVDDTDQPYSVYIPDNFDESRAYPLVVFLHGAWSNHRLGMRRLFGVGNAQGYDFVRPGTVSFENDVEATRYWPDFKPVDYIAAAPYARGTAGYQGIPEQSGYAFMGSKVERLRKYPDFILFKETPDNAIVQGTFDNNWKLPAEAAGAFRASGAVTVK
ncbi:MAG: hypothetical protein L0Y37_00540 [Bacteroidales bacterium]|nr:hypothetical protein [Bacteroidales bacterium]